MASFWSKFWPWRSSGNTVVVWDTSTLSSLPRDLAGVPAIVRAIQLISLDCARLPLEQRRRNGERVEDSAAISLLEGDACDYMSGVELRAWLRACALATGNGYAFIRRDLSTGTPVALEPLAADAVTISTEGPTPTYKMGDQPVDSMSILHFKALVDPSAPWLGVSPVTQCARVLSTQAILDQVAEEFAKGGMIGKMGVVHPGPLTSAARTAMADAWATTHQDPANAGRPAFFGEAMEPKQLAADACARMLEAKRFGVAEVARAFNVPPQLLYEGEGRATFEVMQTYASSCLAGVLALEDAELTRKLCPVGQRIRHDLSPITVGDFVTAGRAYAQLVQVGVLAPNDVRRRMGLHEIDGMDTPEPVISGVTPQDQQGEQDNADTAQGDANA